jgi:hypothetical protein
MKRSPCYTSLIILLFSASAYSQNYVWTKSFGGTDQDLFLGTTFDNTGNMYAYGYFRGTADLDPGPGVANLTSVGLVDFFIARYDGNGNYLWSKSMGGASMDYVTSLILDDSLNIFLAGQFMGTSDFDPGIGVANLTAGGMDGFFAKYDSSGNFTWVKQIGGTLDDWTSFIQIDSSRNIYVSGAFQTSSCDFDPGSGTNFLTNNGSFDGYIAKYSPAGNFIWAKGIGGIGYDYNSALLLDAGSNILTTGFMFYNTVDFDPGPGSTNITSGGGFDMAVAVYDTSCALTWVKSFNSSGNETIRTLLRDQNNNIFLSANFDSPFDMDPGPGAAFVNTVGNQDILFAKYGPTGNFIWGKSIGSVGPEEGASLAVNPAGEVYMAGTHVLTIDLDPGPGTFNLTSTGNTEIFFAKYSSVGTFIWGAGFGSFDGDAAHYAKVYNGNVYFGGVYYDTIDFNPGTAVDNFISDGMQDIFLSKYSELPASTEFERLTVEPVVFPNPTEGPLTIVFSNSEYAISLYDILGNLLFTGRETRQLDLSSYAKGIYKLVITTSNGAQSVKKIILQ